MNAFLFETIQVSQIWNVHKSILQEYYKLFGQYQFRLASSLAEHLTTLIDGFVHESKDAFEDDFYNDCFRFYRFSDMLRLYATYWYEVSYGNYRQSWDTLQDTINCLKALKKFSSFNKTVIFSFLEIQLQGLERLYPYRIFASAEWLIEEAVCSICGKSINSFDCPHIVGELYRGKMACAIMTKCQALGIALTEHPADKKCVTESVDGEKLSFTGVEYLQKQLASVHPFRISHVIEMTQDTFNKSNGIEEFSMCPCGSRKNYKNCCLGKDRKIKHARIVLHHTSGLIVDDLVRLRQDNNKN